MKFRPILFFILFIIPLIGWAQTDLNEIVNSQYQINKTGMTVLGGWAISNIGIGLIRMQQTSGTTFHFNQMNFLWNTVNLGLASFGYFTAGQILESESLSDVIAYQHRFETILLVNAALDLGYVVGGFYLKERAKNSMKNGDRFTGFGNSLLLQGAFLLAFDTILYLIHQSNNELLMRAVDNLAINYNSVSGFSAGFSFSF